MTLLSVFFLITIISLIPILLLGSCDVPYADDYSYGVLTHLTYISSHSVIKTIISAFVQAKDTYFSWQGTFSAIFLMALQPAVFSFQLYAMTPWIVVVAFFAGVCMFSVGVVHHLFGGDRSIGILTGVLIFDVCIQLMPSPVQGLYWYNSAVYYVLFFSLSLISFYLLIRLIKRKITADLIIMSFINFLLGGGNYVTAMMCFLANLSVIILLILLKNKAFKRVSIPFMFLTISFLISALAPGNGVRQGQLQYQPIFFKSFLEAFRTATHLTLKWTNLIMLGASVFLVLLWMCLEENDTRQFRYPWLVTIWSFCMLAGICFPPLYAMGNIGDQRVVNILYFAYVILFIFNLYYWMHWMCKCIKFKISVRGSKWWIAAGTAGIILCSGIYVLQGYGLTSLMAVGEIRSGEARIYYEAASERRIQLEDPQVKDVLLEPFPCTPYLLYIGDIEDSMESYLNQDMSSFYGKNSIILIKHKEEE